MDPIISNPREFEEKKKKFIEGGPGNLHVLSDFDRTLTKAFFKGRLVNSVISELRKGNYLSEDCVKKSKDLASIYSPIEVDPKIPIEEKVVKMREWWSKHFALMVASGLRREHIKAVVDKGNSKFRKGALEFLDMLREKEIPLVIISSAGLGGEFIKMFFEKENRFFENVHIISNYLKFNDEGKCVGVNEPIIHVFNKKEVSLKGLPFYQDLLKRKNVILLGDSLGDLDMIKGFPYKNLIKIGFLNYLVEENLKEYKKNYDVVILGDGDFGFINDLLLDLLVKDLGDSPARIGA